jgi:recombinational DNA repair ATPase RecF
MGREKEINKHTQYVRALAKNAKKDEEVGATVVGAR